MAEIISGRYHIQEKIGSGGMGTVFHALDRLTNETVALKRIRLNTDGQPPKSASLDATQEQLRLSLAHEFQILAGLRHPYIISVLDYGFDEERQPFLTMTYLPESQTILDALQNKSLEDKIELIHQLLQALAYLHRRGVLHRDLKPDNVLVIDGVVRILDFGLSMSATGSSLSSGTPIYMAPELFEGARYTAAADLYAIGVLIYQLLTGKHPFAPFDHKFLDRVLDEEPEWHEIDEQIRPFLAQLLAKSANARFATASKALLAFRSVLNQQPSPDTTAIRESYLQAATFVGREAEMDQLQSALSQAARGSGSTWLVGGESGVGKSRLLDEFQTQALVAGFYVWRGQAVAEGGLPFQVWQGILGPLILNTTLSTEEAGILKQVYPRIEMLLGHAVPAVPALEGQANLQRLVSTLVRLILRQNRPLILVLEDLQWAQDSLQMLEQLLYELDGRKILIVGTFRNDERPTLPSELGEVVKLLTLHPFDEAGIHQLADAMLGQVGQHPALVAALQKETEGNVFFLVETLRAWAEEAGGLRQVGDIDLPTIGVTDGILQVVRRRLGKVPARYQPLLQLAAISGRELDLAVLSQLCEEFSIEDWLLACNEAMVLEIQEGGWQFSHDKLRGGLLNDLSESVKSAGHGKVAAAIEAVYEHPEEHAVLLAYHWGGAGSGKKYIHYGIQASEQLARSGNFEEIVSIVEDILASHDSEISEDDKCDLLRKLGEANRAVNRYAESLASYRAGLELAYRSANQQAIVDHLIGLGWSTWGQLQYKNDLSNKESWTEAEGHFQQALAVADKIDDQVSMGRCLHQLGLVFSVRDNDKEKGIDYMQRGLTLFEAANERRYMLISLYDIGLFTVEKNLAEGKRLLTQALAVAQEMGKPRIFRYILQTLANVAVLEGAWEALDGYLEELLPLSHNRRGVFFSASNRLAAILAIHRGDFASAERYVEMNLTNKEYPHLDVFFDHCQKGAIALLQADRPQLQSSLGTSISKVRNFPATHIAYLAVLHAGACMLTGENRKGEAWLALGEAHLATSSNPLQERSNHVKDMIDLTRDKFQDALATASANDKQAVDMSLDSIMTTWSDEESDQLANGHQVIQAFEAELFGDVT